MNGKPLVSAVIPSYNYGRYVTQAVDSALAQTYPNLEVIVVDDGSTDDTRDRLQPYMNRIRCIHQKNSGLSAARNTGIQAAKGKWIALLDADDLWHPRKTELQLDSAKKDGEFALIGSPHAATISVTLPEAAAVQRLSIRDLLLSTRMGPSSVLLNRRALESVGGFDVSLRSVEDRDMWLRVASRFPCALVDAPCWWYRTHTGQMNRNADRMLQNYQRVLDKFFEANPKHLHFRRMAISYMYFDNSWSNFEEGRRLTALIRIAQSTWRMPLSLGDHRKPRWIRLKLAVRISLGRRPALMSEGQPDQSSPALAIALPLT